MYRFIGLRNLMPWRAMQSNIDTPKQYNSKGLAEYSYVVVRSPELDEMKGGTGWVSYQKRIGDRIHEEDVVAKVDTDLYIVSVFSPVEGVLDEVYVPDGTKVKSHQGMFRVRQEPPEYVMPRRRKPVETEIEKPSSAEIDNRHLDYIEHEPPPVEYVNRMCPKHLHNYTEPGQCYRSKSMKLRNRYNLD